MTRPPKSLRNYRAVWWDPAEKVAVLESVGGKFYIRVRPTGRGQWKDPGEPMFQMSENAIVRAKELSHA